MKNFDKRNPVYCAAQEAWERYGDHLGGLLSGPVCVVSEKPLPVEAVKALDASANALGYGAGAITFVTLRAQEKYANPEQDQSQGQAQGTAPTLSGKQLFGIIEAVDPLVLIASDSQAVSALSHAYRAEFSPNAPARLFGRNAVGFLDFAAMLADADEKQRAWAHLKRLGHKPKQK